MKISKNENKIKTVFNIYEPLIQIMKRELDKACLKRDAYLDLALRCEAGFLQKEVTMSNSDEAKSYITESLKQLKLKPVNLLLSTETVNLMNGVCKKKNIPRDAFINRVFLLMIATDTVIETLFWGLFEQLFASKGQSVDKKDWENAWDDWGSDDGRFDTTNLTRQWDSTHQWDYEFPNILDNIQALTATPPLWRLRSFFKREGFEGLYNYSFKRHALVNLPLEYGPLRAESTIGFNTFMSDDDVSKQEVYRSEINIKAKTDKLLAFMLQEKQAKMAKIESAKKEKQTSEKATNTKLAGESQ